MTPKEQQAKDFAKLFTGVMLEELAARFSRGPYEPNISADSGLGSIITNKTSEVVRSSSIRESSENIRKPAWDPHLTSIETQFEQVMAAARAKRRRKSIFLARNKRAKSAGWLRECYVHIDQLALSNDKLIPPASSDPALVAFSEVRKKETESELKPDDFAPIQALLFKVLKASTPACDEFSTFTAKPSAVDSLSDIVDSKESTAKKLKTQLENFINNVLEGSKCDNFIDCESQNHTLLDLSFQGALEKADEKYVLELYDVIPKLPRAEQTKFIPSFVTFFAKRKQDKILKKILADVWELPGAIECFDTSIDSMVYNGYDRYDAIKLVADSK